MPRRNIYFHSIDLKKLKIKNTNRSEFVKLLERIEYRGYEVESISDGRKIVIAKPGGKQSWGRISKEDFFVFIYDHKEGSLWQITHKQIFEDLETKGKENPTEAIKIINALERVYNGEDPDDFLSKTEFKNPVGESPEALLKAYKWIWGQEDVNYQGEGSKGRAMSWEGWEKGEEGKWLKTGNGIVDLRDQLQKLRKAWTLE